MNILRITLIPVVLLGFFHSAQAYDFTPPPCKIVDGWKPLFGKCNADGLLQGAGGAINSNMVARGQFSNGRPDGRHEFALAAGACDPTEKYMASCRGAAFYLNSEMKYSDATSWSDFVALNPNATTLAPENLFCSMYFENGQVAAKEIICKSSATNAGGTAEFSKQFSILPFDGKVRLVKTKAAGVSLEFDVPKVLVQDQTFSDYSMSRSTGGRRFEVSGQADSVILRATEIRMVGLTGDFVSKSLVTPFPDREHNKQITGYFNSVCSRATFEVSCSFDPIRLAPTGSQVEKKYLTTFILDDKKFQLIYKASKNNSKDEIYYFKSPEGLEFDGSAGRCDPTGGSAKLEVKNKGERYESGNIRRTNFSYYLEIKPVCGKITMPDGRSFTGRFDGEGRPTTPD